jgi:UDP-glucuronate decarboxylase
MKELKGKIILITGASGLIGTHLINSLQGIPCQVYGVTYQTPSQLQGDLTDIDFVRSLPKADYIIHGAGYAQPKRFLEDPIKTITLNTTTLIELSKKLNPNGKLLFLSSSEVYSDSRYVPYRETDIGLSTPSHKRACYIESKRCGEAICNSLGANIARLSLVYGPGTKAGDCRVMNELIAQGLKGEIRLLDDGRAKRQYCYVTDAIELLWKILLYGEGTYNVGGHSRVTIKELAERIAEYLNVPIAFGTQGLEAPKDVRLDMEKTETEFNKTEYVDLTTGLANTIEWQKLLYGG